MVMITRGKTARLQIVLFFVLFLFSCTTESGDVNDTFFRAAQKGNGAVMETLLDQGFDVNARDKNGRTALIYAVSEGHMAVVELLLDNGADLDLEDRQGMTALKYALDFDHEEMAEILKAAGAESLGSLCRLFKAALEGDIATVEALSARGLDLNTRDNRGMTALIYATEGGQDQIVEMLLSRDADMDVKDLYRGQTALMIAAEKGHAKIAEILIAMGADVNATCNSGMTALMYGALQGEAEIVRLLLLNDAVVDARDMIDETALRYATMFANHTETVHLLKQAGAKND